MIGLRPLLSAADRCCAGARAARRPSRVSRSPDHDDRAVRARRPDRHRRPHPFDVHAANARAKPHRRQPRRRGRQHRHGPGRTRQARRLHAADDLDRHRGESGAVQQPALRSDQGLRPDLRTGERAERPRGAARLRHQDDCRPGRKGEGGAQHLQLWQSRRRHEVASHRRAAQAARRHRHGARAVPWRGTGGAGRAGQADPGRIGGARRRRAADQVGRSDARLPSPAKSAGSRCRTCRP